MTNYSSSLRILWHYCKKKEHVRFEERLSDSYDIVNRSIKYLLLCFWVEVIVLIQQVLMGLGALVSTLRNHQRPLANCWGLTLTPGMVNEIKVLTEDFSRGMWDFNMDRSVLSVLGLGIGLVGWERGGIVRRMNMFCKWSEYLYFPRTTWEFHCPQSRLVCIH